MSRKHDLTYGSHLQLARLLGAMDPVSDVPDEVLFITQHQTSELWIRLMLHELEQARNAISKRHIPAATKALERVAVVLTHLVASWDVLRTLAPEDFSRFRGALGSASGFQSHQYRLLEFMLGNRVPSRLQEHGANRDAIALLEAELSRPSIYEGLSVSVAGELQVTLPPDAFRRDAPHTAHPSILQLWRRVQDPDAGHAGYRALAGQLVEIEDRFRCWRFNHVTTVERVIGTRRGTGGTSGVGYLRKMLDVELFPELWQLRAEI
ncbi:tryptophan 2,3-dioxygenase [Aliiruegeria haliotis]|uniref:Tryptophan 2,3-dioxygenase n=1 Tax=Aliiruegeria haliotis TaxID=1280846 RepID=A0A2T0RRQ1_9RHOB|nr:tryptophan 2,3-dioxygenase family protein [Aliiruegeria haliotis]PRY23848.1 tryptophan 2,3-dioxygenase [Aliiruegeria haliotis]